MEKIVIINGAYQPNQKKILDDVNKELAEGWKVKMIVPTTSDHFAYVVLEKE